MIRVTIELADHRARWVVEDLDRVAELIRSVKIPEEQAALKRSAREIVPVWPSILETIDTLHNQLAEQLGGRLPRGED